MDPDSMQNILDSVGMNGMDLLLQQLLSSIPAAPASMTDTMSSTLSPSLSPTAPESAASSTGEETVGEALGRRLSMKGEEWSGGRAASPVPAPPSSTREAYVECFASVDKAEVDALMYSLFVTSRGVGKDGFELFECLSRTKLKCRYKVRAKDVEGVCVVEEKGVHSHSFDAVAFNSQGLPRTIREIVDLSFNEGWSNQERQEAVDAEVVRLGLPPNPKMNRQMDNRLSYLRRTKNISSSSIYQGGQDFRQLANFLAGDGVGLASLAQLVQSHSENLVPSTGI